MRFRESTVGRTILQIPGGERLLSLGRTMLGPYYWCKYGGFRRLRHELARWNWARRQSRDGLTWRVLTNRLDQGERAQKYLPVHLRCFDGPLLARPLSTDRKVIREIFCDEGYHPIHGWTYRSVLDCGANVGIFAAYAQSQAGDTLRTYVGAEPDPASFSILSEMVRLRGMQSISTLYQAAVARADGTARFDTRGESWAHRLSDQGELQVQTLSINSLLDRCGLDEVDLLKLDIEGGEKEVLEAWPAWRDRVRCIVVELHDFWDPQVNFDWFARLARTCGYRPMPPGALFRGLPGAVREDIGH
jgi:FkbM family methyltransferase